MMAERPGDAEVGAIRDAVRVLHKTLLDAERLVYERSFGRIGSDFYLLKLAAEDPQFAWLRALSAEMLRLDAAVRAGDPASGDVARLLGMRLRALLLGTGRPTPFATRYQATMQQDPKVIMAHSAVMRALPPALPWSLFRSEGEVETFAEGTLRVRMHRPGTMVPGADDHGYGPLAMIGESFLPPGTVIPMHEHRNEDIVSWVPAGVMRHDDLVQGSVVTDPSTLLVMNAGRGFSHAEATGDSDPDLRMLQVFIRPHTVDLEPMVQHGPIADAQPGAWRQLIGPDAEAAAPFTVRNNVEMHDLRLGTSAQAVLPGREGWHRVLFIFDGEIRIAGIPLTAAESAVIQTDVRVAITAQTDSTVVAFAVDPAAKVTRAGTYAR